MEEAEGASARFHGSSCTLYIGNSNTSNSISFKVVHSALLYFYLGHWTSWNACLWAGNKDTCVITSNAPADHVSALWHAPRRFTECLCTLESFKMWFLMGTDGKKESKKGWESKKGQRERERAERVKERENENERSLEIFTKPVAICPWGAAQEESWPIEGHREERHDGNFMGSVL